MCEGSPWIVNHLRRDTDRMVLAEVHPSDYTLLRREFEPDTSKHQKTANVTVVDTDGYDTVLKHVPPAEKRGLVLMDPPYELKVNSPVTLSPLNCDFQSEWTRIAAGFSQAHKLWPWGCFMMWYPVASRLDVDAFHQTIRNTGIKKILLAEMTTAQESDDKGKLYGSGITISSISVLTNIARRASGKSALFIRSGPGKDCAMALGRAIGGQTGFTQGCVAGTGTLIVREPHV